MINAEQVRAAILEWPGLYEREDGSRFMGMPVSQVPSQLRDCRWRNVSNLDAYDFRKMGLTIVTARYVGGARAKRFCEVVVAKEIGRLIYPPRCFTYNAPHSDGTKAVEIDYECYLDAVKTKKVGDLICAYAGAPGTGRRVDRITCIDETGVYGVEVENTIRVLDPCEVA